ncbi:MAG TPA: aminoglycoside 6-adenylyltransferase [Candidatus Limnocylindria bacterium]|nr:aminoglycoside 6-adenylyltransferase [Candidatus Limnocylindria bacterium]
MPDGAGTPAVRFAPDPAGLLARIEDWARTDVAVHGLILLGSRARSDHPADVWSDTDLIVVVEDPAAFLADAFWPSRFGAVAITFIEQTGHGRRERRVLYEDGTDLDVVPVPAAEIRGGLSDPGALAILGRGHRVLVDKAGLFDALPEQIRSAEDTLRREDEWPPGVVTFENLVGDFWYHAVWSARKLRRGELWVALLCVDGYMKRLLLAVMAWRARAGAGNGEPWVEGRLLERWAEPEALAALGGIFARYEAAEIAAALRGTMDLFRRLATDLSVRLELPYPARADDAATRLVGELLPPPRR